LLLQFREQQLLLLDLREAFSRPQENPPYRPVHKDDGTRSRWFQRKVTYLVQYGVDLSTLLYTIVYILRIVDLCTLLYYTTKIVYSTYILRVVDLSTLIYYPNRVHSTCQQNVHLYGSSKHESNEMTDPTKTTLAPQQARTQRFLVEKGSGLVEELW
jgi:hypothetical protein